MLRKGNISAEGGVTSGKMRCLRLCIGSPELRRIILCNCAYHEEFSKEKLLSMDMPDERKFAYSDSELYCNDKGFMVTGDNLKYLCAVLDSSLINWLMRNTGLTTGMELMQWKKFAVERLPIPSVKSGGIMDHWGVTNTACVRSGTGHAEPQAARRFRWYFAELRQNFGTWPFGGLRKKMLRF